MIITNNDTFDSLLSKIGGHIVNGSYDDQPELQASPILTY